MLPGWIQHCFHVFLRSPFLRILYKRRSCLVTSPECGEVVVCACYCCAGAGEGAGGGSRLQVRVRCGGRAQAHLCQGSAGAGGRGRHLGLLRGWGRGSDQPSSIISIHSGNIYSPPPQLHCVDCTSGLWCQHPGGRPGRGSVSSNGAHRTQVYGMIWIADGRYIFI